MLLENDVSSPGKRGREQQWIGQRKTVKETERLGESFSSCLI